MPHFSLVIIGSGSGNVLVPHDRAQGPVALIESGAFGGTCINRGCIPSKILIQTAQVAEQVRHAPEFGIEARLTGVDWPAIRDRTFTRTDWHSAAGRRHRAESDKVTLIEVFTAPQIATVGAREQDLARGQYWIHPALTEVVENALLKLPLDPDARRRA